MTDFMLIDLHEFGPAVRAWRERVGLLQKDAAYLAGTTSGTLSNLENTRRLGIRLTTYNHLVRLIGMEPRLFWWDYQQRTPGVYARGQHDESMLRELCAVLWGKRGSVEVDGTQMTIEPELFRNAPYRVGYLTRLPSTYGYQLSETARQGAFLASVMSL